MSGGFHFDEDAGGLRQEFAGFARQEIAPFADEWDIRQAIPEEIISRLGEVGYLGASIPVEYGGKGWSQSVLAILNEEIGKACSSCRSLLTVHLSLVTETLLRWGTSEQKKYWLPLLAGGKKIAAFGLTEPLAGSDAQSIGSSYREEGGSYVINGEKKWITFGQRADVFLIFARDGKSLSAFLVERDTPGLEITPITGMMGTRSSLLAGLVLNNCKVPAGNMLGARGWGFLQIASTALDNGRFSVAAGSLGIARACLEHSIRHSRTRKQFGVFLKEHQLIKQKIANMSTHVKAAGLMCYHAAGLRDAGSPDALIQTSQAKYFASRIANEAAADAIQIYGAAGFHERSPVQRYYRDAKVMEIIEGSSEIQQIVIADHAISDLSSGRGG